MVTRRLLQAVGLPAQAGEAGAGAGLAQSDWRGFLPAPCIGPQPGGQTDLRAAADGGLGYAFEPAGLSEAARSLAPGSVRPESAGAQVKNTASDSTGLARAGDCVSDELPGGADAAAGE